MPVLVRWFHISGMAMVAAGTVFVRLALGPAPSGADASRDRELLERVGPAWRAAIWVVLATGVYNLFHLRPRPSSDVRALYIALLAAKLVLVSTLFTIVFGVTATAPRPWFWEKRRGLLAAAMAVAAAIVALSALLRSLR